MKTKTILLTVLAAFVMTGSVKAQLQINSDGGVRIGTAPSTGWTLSSKGFELNYGEIVFNTLGGGQIKITGASSSAPALSLAVIGGDPRVKPTYLTGKQLNIGQSNNYVSSIYANYITSPQDVDVTSDRRAKENIQTITGAKDVDMKGRTVYKETLKKGDLSGEIEIPAGKLAPGLYTYSLVADNRTLDSKKMVVIE